MADFEIIKTTQISPYRSICRLKTRRGIKKIFTSTGCFIHPRVIITAAHNIYNPALNRVRSLIITPAMNGEVEPYGNMNLDDELPDCLSTMDGYRFVSPTSTRRQVDFGIIILSKEASGQLTGWTFEEDFLIDPNVMVQNGNEIHIAGYPAEQENDPSFDGTVMMHDKGQVLNINNKFIEYDLLSEGGNSGSPAWVVRGGKNILVGIHTFDGGATYLTKDNLIWLQNELRNI